jgi:hypothetical protein
MASRGRSVIAGAPSLENRLAAATRAARATTGKKAKLAITGTPKA